MEWFNGLQLLWAHMEKGSVAWFMIWLMIWLGILPGLVANIYYVGKWIFRRVK